MYAMPNASLRNIPSVEKVMQGLGPAGLPRPLVVAIVQRALENFRETGDIPPLDSVLGRIRGEIENLRSCRLGIVLNGTGIIIHTNLGRAPLPREVVETVSSVAGNYANLEYDLLSGERGGRGEYAEKLLALLCESEAAMVVNNCAAALVLGLRHFSRTKPEVVISRGELVQIGGGFRIPEILESSGAVLKEIGTTNKTTISDYRRAVSEKTGLILKVHLSNFYMKGFVEAAAVEEISAVCRGCGIPFLMDLGSGACFKTEEIPGLRHELTPAEVLKRGADLVCFSGDKLLGGPQAGILAGSQELIKALKKEPFFRALRCDKLILSALQTIAELYLNKGKTVVQEMLGATIEDLRKRAEGIQRAVTNGRFKVRVGSGKAQAGGGTLPDCEVESVVLEVVGDMKAEEIAKNLRTGSPPLIGYILEDRFRIDLRTIFPSQDAEVINLLNRHEI